MCSRLAERTAIEYDCNCGARRAAPCFESENNNAFLPYSPGQDVEMAKLNRDNNVLMLKIVNEGGQCAFRNIWLRELAD